MPPSQSVPGGSTSYTWAGLTNGTTYQFQIRAINKTPTQQQFSPSSAAVAPFGKPAVMMAPVAEALSNGADGGRTIRALWEPSDDNGDPIAGYRLVTRFLMDQTRPLALPQRVLQPMAEVVAGLAEAEMTRRAQRIDGHAQ